MGILNNSNAISVDSGYDITDSLRLRRSATAYLQRTPSSAGNRKTWTWSCWVKKSFVPENVAPYPSQLLLFANDNATTANTNTAIQFLPTNTIRFLEQVNGGSTAEYNLTSTQLFRDPSAWYHVVVAYDTTQSTASNRVKIYINGTQITSFSSSTYPSLNFDGNVNKTCIHSIGSDVVNGVNGTLDGYMTEVNFVDGTALAPSDFGETDSNGTWIPKKYTGTYGTNGFYLPMNPTTQATGFNTVLYAGNNGTQAITGVGFTPDFVWIKQRTDTASHVLSDTVRGATKSLLSNSTAAEDTNNIYGYLSAFNSNGFTVTTGTSNAGRVNETSDNYVAWCWDAGSSTVTNTDGTLSAQVRANPATGFSIATYTGNATAGATFGHGLGVAPTFVIVKGRTNTDNWMTWHTDYGGGSYFIELNTTNARGSATDVWNNTVPSSSVVTLGTGATVNQVQNYVAYCFADVTGYQKAGSYTGNGSTTGPTVTTGFRPTFILIKSVNTAKGWGIWDGTRSVNNPLNKVLFPAASNAEDTSDTYYALDVTDTGFQLKNSDSSWNVNGNEFIYLAIADTRDAKFNFDASGNKNNWTPNNINSSSSGESTYDIMSDVPTLTDEDTANFATLNPLGTNNNSTITDGNLTVVSGSGASTTGMTIGMTTGKWYAEYVCTAKSSVNMHVALVEASTFDGDNQADEGTNNGYMYQNDGNVYHGGASDSYGASWAVGDVIGIAFDASTRNVEFFKNGAGQGTYTRIASENSAGTTWIMTCGEGQGGSTATFAANFGQRPFAYTPPTGYKKLNTFNLPDSTVKDGSDYFDTVLYSGTGSTQSITGVVGFAPDWVWLKVRNTAGTHVLSDSVRGANKQLFSNLTNAEASATNKLTGFTSNGFTLGADDGSGTGDANYSGNTYAAWNWKANGTAVSNTDGTIGTSTVSANPTAGFSIVTYTGTGSNATVGHGLGVAPAMVIIKRRDNGSGGTNWRVYHQRINGGVNPAQYYLSLNSTAAQAGLSAMFNDTPPTSTVFNIGTHVSVNGSGGTYVAYCFADVEGYSKFGSYTGNGSTDGPFVYTGFRPAFLLLKNSNTTNGWGMFDVKRDTYNIVNQYLEPNASNAEAAYINWQFDFLSNGFKLRSYPAETNGSGNTIIYMAFAENPFKNSNAR